MSHIWIYADTEDFSDNMTEEKLKNLLIYLAKHEIKFNYER